MSKAQIHAVLTGDIVGSQKLSDDVLSRIPELIADAAAKAKFDGKIEVFSGDSWQVYCKEPHRAIDWAVDFRAYLFGKHGIESRVAIGIGAVASLNEKKVSMSQGEAFVLSGQALEEMPSEHRIVIDTTPDIGESVGALLHANCILLDALSSYWTQKQALAIALANSNLPQQSLAKKFNPPISPQAFGKHLASANWKSVKTALATIATGIILALPKS